MLDHLIDPDDEPELEDGMCPHCEGTGKRGYYNCRKCNGTGKIEEDELEETK